MNEKTHTKTVYGVGYLGVGPHKSRVPKSINPNQKQNKAYVAWTSMLQRCYNQKTQTRCPTYVGCSVAPIWHNYQNFAEWFWSNYPGAGYELDKDAVVPGNKIYSPDTCCFLTRQQNIEVAKAKKVHLIDPQGQHHTIFNLTKFSRENCITPGALHKVVVGERRQHKGWTAPKHQQENI